jgi:ankyrin repeat protein
VRALADGVALVTYTATSRGTPARTSLRSSVWVAGPDSWRVLHHQGTTVAPEATAAAGPAAATPPAAEPLAAAAAEPQAAEPVTAADTGHAAAFVVAATDARRARAEGLLEAHPEIVRDPWARLVIGLGWAGDPVQPGGPRGWAPLLYACHSCFAPVALARDLLARGADPDSYFVNEYGEMSALYGAAGVVHDPELTRVLLDAGADPDDGESLYHATEAPDPACLRLLLKHGAETRGTNALAHALDEDRYEHVRLLLEAGPDPRCGALLAHAVRRGRTPDVLRLLVAHGAELDRPGGETWRGAVPLRTPYQHAVLRGRDDQAAVLAELGASTEVAEADRAVAAIARGERPDAPMPATLDPDAQEVLVLAALRGHLDLVVEAVGPDFKGVVGGSPSLPLIGHAAWVGDAELVRRLLEHGADPHLRGDAEHATPLAVAALGSQYHAMPGRDYVATAELLVAAGNEIEPRMRDVADGPLAAWLDERLG